jgi:hypothetical protein
MEIKETIAWILLAVIMAAAFTLVVSTMGCVTPTLPAPFDPSLNAYRTNATDPEGAASDFLIAEDVLPKGYKGIKVLDENLYDSMISGWYEGYSYTLKFSYMDGQRNVIPGEHTAQFSIGGYNKNPLSDTTVYYVVSASLDSTNLMPYKA